MMGFCAKGLTKVALCQKVDKLASYQEEDTRSHTAAQDDERDKPLGQLPTMATQLQQKRLRFRTTKWLRTLIGKCLMMTV